jgi:hypothetical protein
MVLDDAGVALACAEIQGGLSAMGPSLCAQSIIESGISIQDQQKLLLHIAHSTATWRSERVFDLFVAVLSENGELRWSIKDTQRFIGLLPRLPEQCGEVSVEAVNAVWLPHEIGRLIGSILSKEMELDVMTTLIANVVTQEWPKQWKSGAQPPEWYSYLGYAGVMLTDALAINKKWVDEDYQWVVNDFAHDVGIWAVETWGPEVYSKFEHQLLLTDLISTLAIKYGRFNHDIRLIQMMLNMICMNWPEHEHEVLAALIQERMKSMSIKNRTKNWLKLQLGSNEVPTKGQLAQSQLWSNPESLRGFIEGGPRRSILQKLSGLLDQSTSKEQASGLVVPRPDSLSLDRILAEKFAAVADPHEAYRIKLESGKAAALQLEQHKPEEVDPSLLTANTTPKSSSGSN